MEISKCIDQWDWIYKTGHIYNTNPRLPEFLNALQNLIVLFQVFPILTGQLFLVEDENNMMRKSIKCITKGFLFIDYVPSKIRAITAICLSLIGIISFVIMYLWKRVLMIPAFSYYISFMFEFALPTGFCTLMALFEQEIERYIIQKDNLMQLVLFSITCTIVTIFYFIKIKICSKPLFIPGTGGGRWNYQHKFIIELLVMYCFLFRALRIKIGKYSVYINCSIFLLINIFSLYIVFENPLFRKSDMYVSCAVSLISLAQCIVQMVYVSFQERLSTGLTFIDFTSSFIALGIAFEISSYSYFRKYKIESNDESEEFIELDDVSCQDEFIPIEANSKNTIKILHRLARVDMPKAVSFASYCAEITKDNNIKVECYRLLALMHHLSTEEAEDCRKIRKNDVSFSNRQLLCDLHFETSALLQDDEVIDSYCDKLNECMNTLRQLLYRIIEEIPLESKEILLPEILKFRKECSKFEDTASLIISYFPRSTKIANIISDYFHQIKFDFNLAQSWLAYASNLSLDTDSNISISTSDIVVERAPSISKTRIMGENQLSHKYTAQMTINGIHSLGIISGVIGSVLFGVLLIFSSLYTYIPSSFSFLYDHTMVNTTNAIAHVMRKTLESYYNISTNILKSCDPKFEPYFGEDKFMALSERKEPLISLVNEISNHIYLINSKLTYAENEIKKWAIDPISTESNYTNHFGAIISAVLSNWNYDNTCSNRTTSYLNLFIKHFNLTIQPLHYLQMDLITLSNRIFVLYQNKYFTFYTILSILVISSATILYYMLYIRKDKEMNNFMEVLQEVNPNAIAEMKNHLIRGEHLIISSKSPEFVTDSENALSSDDTCYSHEMQSSSEDSREKHPYKPIKPISVELSSLENNISCFKRNRNVLLALLFILLSAVFIVFMYLYYFPVIESTKMSFNLDVATSSLTTIISCMQMYSTSCAIEHINRKTDPNINSFKYLKSIYDFSNEIKSFLFGIYSNEYKDFVGINLYSELYKGVFRNFYHIFLNITELVPKCRENAINGIIDYENIDKSYRLAFYNYTVNLDKIQEAHLYNIEQSQHKLYLSRITFSVTMEFITFIFLFILAYRIYLYIQEFKGLKTIVLVLSSHISNPASALVAKFGGRKLNNIVETHKNILPRTIIKQSTNAIFIVDSTLTIQDINSAACQLLQQKKENIIQKSLNEIIHNPKDKSVFEQQYVSLYNCLDFFKEESTMQVVINSETEYSILIRYGTSSKNQRNFKAVNCRVVPLNSIEVWGDDMSFAFIMRDQTNFFRKERELKDAQLKVESLLNRIMPKVIASRLLSKGDEQSRKITSKVDKATIIFIGIHNFTEWCATKTHREIMELLDVVFSKFDAIIVNYQALVRIKIINGVYMAAGGLFNEISERIPVHEAVEFCLECGKWVKKRNKIEHKSLQLHIGVNYDGPIISGVLGQDKPLFDIWGDAVNVSARLETSSISDTIQMSEETYKALPAGEYCAKEREGVFLKGKGITKTYYLEIPDYEEVEIIE